MILLVFPSPPLAGELDVLLAGELDVLLAGEKLAFFFLSSSPSTSLSKFTTPYPNSSTSSAGVMEGDDVGKQGVSGRSFFVCLGESGTGGGESPLDLSVGLPSVGGDTSVCLIMVTSAILIRGTIPGSSTLAIFVEFKGRVVACATGGGIKGVCKMGLVTGIEGDEFCAGADTTPLLFLDLLLGFGIGNCDIPTSLETDLSTGRGCVLLDTLCCEVRGGIFCALLISGSSGLSEEEIEEEEEEEWVVGEGIWTF